MMSIDSELAGVRQPVHFLRNYTQASPRRPRLR
jgi:hypothetical protein